VESPALLAAVWVAGGVFPLSEALLRELATAFRRQAANPLHRPGLRAPARFLYGWARMTVVVAGSIRGVRVSLGDYMSRVIHLGPHSSPLWAALIVTVLTAVNYAGIREGKAHAEFLTFLECGGLVLIIVAGFALAPDPAPAAPSAGAAHPGTWARESARRWCSCCSTYGGWNDRSLYFRGGARSPAQHGARAAALHRDRDRTLPARDLAYLKGLATRA